MLQNVDCSAGREQGLADLSADTEINGFYLSISLILCLHDL